MIQPLLLDETLLPGEFLLHLGHLRPEALSQIMVCQLQEPGVRDVAPVLVRPPMPEGADYPL
jgi:hypothetical protein